MDKETIEAWKNFVTNLLMFGFVALTLGVGAYFGRSLIHAGQPLKDSLQVLVIITAIPTLIFGMAWNRISQETIGVLFGIILGFAMGKVM